MCCSAQTAHKPVQISSAKQTTGAKSLLSLLIYLQWQHCSFLMSSRNIRKRLTDYLSMVFIPTYILNLWFCNMLITFFNDFFKECKRSFFVNVVYWDSNWKKNKRKKKIHRFRIREHSMRTLLVLNEIKKIVSQMCWRKYLEISANWVQRFGCARWTLVQIFRHFF